MKVKAPLRVKPAVSSMPPFMINVPLPAVTVVVPTAVTVAPLPIVSVPVPVLPIKMSLPLEKDEPEPVTDIVPTPPVNDPMTKLPDVTLPPATILSDAVPE